MLKLQPEYVTLFMKLGNCFSKFVNLSSSFVELFLDLTTTEPEPELFSFGLFLGAGARAGKARQARLQLEPRSGSLDISDILIRQMQQLQIV